MEEKESQPSTEDLVNTQSNDLTELLEAFRGCPEHQATADANDGDMFDEKEIGSECNASKHTPRSSKSGKQKTPRTKSTPKVNRDPIRAEMNQMKRILYHISDQAVSHHDELLNLEKTMSGNIENIQRRVEATETEVKKWKESVESQLTVIKDELHSAKLTLKFDKKSFTQDMDGKVKECETNLLKKFETLQDEVRKIKSRNDTFDSRDRKSVV